MTNEGGDALSLDRASIDGGAFFTMGSPPPVRCARPVRRSPGQLTMRGATLANEGGNALDLDEAVVGTLVLRGLGPVKRSDVSKAARIGNLILNRDGDAVPTGRLIADGWQINSLHGRMASRADLAQKWLDSRPARPSVQSSAGAGPGRGL